MNYLEFAKFISDKVEITAQNEKAMIFTVIKFKILAYHLSAVESL